MALTEVSPSQHFYCELIGLQDLPYSSSNDNLDVDNAAFFLYVLNYNVQLISMFLPASCAAIGLVKEFGLICLLSRCQIIA